MTFIGFCDIIKNKHKIESKAFMKLVDNNKELLKDNYIKSWYNISKKLLQ